MLLCVTILASFKYGGSMGYTSEALSMFGYKTQIQQIKLMQLYHASGAITDSVPQKVWSEAETKAFIEKNSRFINSNIKFRSTAQAVEWLNEIGQSRLKLLRPNAEGTRVERHEMQTPKELNKHLNFILETFKELGFLTKVVNEKPEAEALLLLGSSTDVMKLKLYDTVEAIKNGELITKKIILTTGARDLWPPSKANNIRGEEIVFDILEKKINVADPRILTAGVDIRKDLQEFFDEKFQSVSPKDAAAVKKVREEIVQFVSHEYGIKWPTETDMMVELAQKQEAFKDIEILSVDAPKIKGQNGELQRPNTESTLKEVKRVYGEDLKSKHIVIMSVQPHCRRQEEIAKRVMGPEYTISMRAPVIDIAMIPKAMLIPGVFDAIFGFMYEAKNRIVEELKAQKIAIGKDGWQRYISAKKENYVELGA